MPITRHKRRHTSKGQLAMQMTLIELQADVRVIEGDLAAGSPADTRAPLPPNPPRSDGDEGKRGRGPRSLPAEPDDLSATLSSQARKILIHSIDLARTNSPKNNGRSSWSAVGVARQALL